MMSSISGVIIKVSKYLHTHNWSLSATTYLQEPILSVKNMKNAANTMVFFNADGDNVKVFFSDSF